MSDDELANILRNIDINLRALADSLRLIAKEIERNALSNKPR